MVVLPQFRTQDSSSGVTTQAQGPVQSLGTEFEAGENTQIGEEALSDNGSDTEIEDLLEDDADDSPDNINDTIAGWESTLQSAMKIAREQSQRGNKAFLDGMDPSFAALRTLVEEVNRKQNRGFMNRTWDKYRHPATM